MSGTLAISTTSRRELSSGFFFPARQSAEGNSRHSDRNNSLFPSCSGWGHSSTPVVACRIRTNQVFFFLQGKAPKEIHAILTETIAYFFPVRAEDIPAPLWLPVGFVQIKFLFPARQSAQGNSRHSDKNSLFPSCSGWGHTSTPVVACRIRANQVFFFFLQGKAPKEIHAILTETIAYFLPVRAEDIPAPL